MKLVWGIYVVWMEEKWFALTTSFVRDPYRIAERVAGVVKSEMGEGIRVKEEEEDGGELIGEFGDEVPGSERERLRTLAFLRAFREVFGEREI
ncbi:hypothetical protein HDU67_002573 [Dinochytrium kinnereticum]|nr:hypothetical protein HDU67_002573 [Dinochytrium kinnereticum]